MAGVSPAVTVCQKPHAQSPMIATRRPIIFSRSVSFFCDSASGSSNPSLYSVLTHWSAALVWG